MMLQNSEADTLTVTGLVVDGAPGFCAAGGAVNASVAVSPGERKTFYVITSLSGPPCTERQVVDLG